MRFSVITASPRVHFLFPIRAPCADDQIRNDQCASKVTCKPRFARTYLILRVRTCIVHITFCGFLIKTGNQVNTIPLAYRKSRSQFLEPFSTHMMTVRLSAHCLISVDTLGLRFVNLWFHYKSAITFFIIDHLVCCVNLINLLDCIPLSFLPD